MTAFPPACIFSGRWFETAFEFLNRPATSGDRQAHRAWRNDDLGYLGYNAIAVQRREGGNPYMQQWNFTIERTLPADIDFQAAYVGTKGTHLLVQFNEINGDNALPQDLLAQWRQAYINTSANPANVRVPNPLYVAPPGTPKIGSGNPNVAGPTITQLQLNRPYPAFTSVRL